MKDIELTKEEQALIDQWLPFYRSLADGTREPKNKIQEHFAAVFQGKASDPERTPHEIAYAKYLSQAGELQDDLLLEAEQDQSEAEGFTEDENRKKLRRPHPPWGH